MLGQHNPVPTDRFIEASQRHPLPVAEVLPGFIIPILTIDLSRLLELSSNANKEDNSKADEIIKRVMVPKITV